MDILEGGLLGSEDRLGAIQLGNEVEVEFAAPV
jgi:hypothetical protein